jgi:hypothetical protein
MPYVNKLKIQLTDLETICGEVSFGRNIYAPDAYRRNHTIQAYNIVII